MVEQGESLGIDLLGSAWDQEKKDNPENALYVTSGTTVDGCDNRMSVWANRQA